MKIIKNKPAPATATELAGTRQQRAQLAAALRLAAKVWKGFAPPGVKL